MKARLLISLLLVVAVCFYGCESTSLDEQLDDSSTTVLPEGKQNPDGDGDDDDEVVELPELPDLEDVDDVCTKMTDLDFMRYCYENFDVNGDAKVSMYEANAVKEIKCNTAKDFTGIEYFPNLESFESYSAKYLDLRYNTQLTYICFYYGYNQYSRRYVGAPIEELDLRYCVNLTSIPGYSFRGCDGLTMIELPSNLTSIGNYAFNYCTSLEEVTSRAVTPPSIYSSTTFGSCSSLTTLYVPSKSVDAYKDSDWANYFSEIVAISE